MEELLNKLDDVKQQLRDQDYLEIMNAVARIKNPPPQGLLIRAKQGPVYRYTLWFMPPGELEFGPDVYFIHTRQGNIDHFCSPIMHVSNLHPTPKTKLQIAYYIASAGLCSNSMMKLLREHTAETIAEALRQALRHINAHWNQSIHLQDYLCITGPATQLVEFCRNLQALGPQGENLPEGLTILR